MKTTCKKCGRELTLPDPGNDGVGKLLAGMMSKILCDPCFAEFEVGEQKKETDYRKKCAVQQGVPAWSINRDASRIDVMRSIVDAVRTNGKKIFLLHGETGAGKTNICARSIGRLIEARAIFTFSWHNGPELKQKFTHLKQSGQDVNEWLNGILSRDLVVIDEFVGRCKQTDSSREFFDMLLERLYNGKHRVVVLTANLYQGWVQDNFPEGFDDHRMKRRIKQCFTVIDLSKAENNAIVPQRIDF